jgi:hypothetical protein
VTHDEIIRLLMQAKGLGDANITTWFWAHEQPLVRDLLAAFWGPSQQLRFQLPVPSFNMEAIEIDISTPMDVSAFSNAEPIIPAAREKGKVKVIEPGKEKRERKESNKIWEMRTFNVNLHDELQPQVSGDLAFCKFLLNPCCSANTA